MFYSMLMAGPEISELLRKAGSVLAREGSSPSPQPYPDYLDFLHDVYEDDDRSSD